MSDSGSEFVLYKDRPEWKDVIPVSQNDGDHSVVRIAYEENFKDVFDYFRAILESNEFSERALELTKDALDLNPGNYTVWRYRRSIIQSLKKNLKDELCYTEEMIKTSEKNYQVWHHRRVIVEWAQDASEENRVTTYFLSNDPKNYHAWQHRQWYIRTFDMYDGELDFVNNLLSEDLRNNSAWNQRYFVVNNTTQMTPDVLEKEIEFTLACISRIRRNESAWNYLRGIIFYVESSSLLYERVRSFCNDLYEHGERSPYLLAFIVDLCEEAMERGEKQEAYSSNRALELCKLLANDIDKIRDQYWFYVAKGIAGKAAKSESCFNVF